MASTRRWLCPVAYLTGMSQFLFDPEDPVRAGYLLEA